MMLADAAPSVPSAGVDAGTVAGHAAGQTASTVAGAASSAPLPGGAGETLGGTVSSLGQTDALFTWGSYFQALAILFIIVALLFIALWFLNRKGGLKLLTRQGNLVLESRMSLGPKKSLAVVRFLNKRVLLGVTDQQITMLTELPTDEDDTAQLDASAADKADFTAHLVRAEENAPENSG